MKQTLFADIVGQEGVKKRLEFYINGYKATKIIPHLMFVGERGTGKTMMGREVAKNLCFNGEKAKPMLEINCSSLKTVRQFFNQVVFPLLMNNDVTILFDEASELPRDLTMALLTILNPNKDNRNVFTFDGAQVEFNFTRLSFMFCTTEPQRVLHALLDRTTRIDLEPYTEKNLCDVLASKCGDIKLDDTIANVAKIVRNNPRSAQKMANDIRSYCKQNKLTKFSNKEWIDLRKILGIRDMGVNNLEFQIMKILLGTNGTRLTDLAVKTGMSSSSIQRDGEIFLLRNNLIEVHNGLRRLTNNGRKYLQEIFPSERS